MSPEHAALATVLAEMVRTLGADGLVRLITLLCLAAPLTMALGMMVIAAYVTHRHGKTLEAYREDSVTRFEAYRDQSDSRIEVNRRYAEELWERHRAEMGTVLKEFGQAVAEIRRYYENNVDLVRGYETVAENLQDVVVASTRTLERLARDIEMFCKTDRRD